MQRERDDDQPAPENLVGKLIKFAPYVAAAMGAGLATAYAVKGITLVTKLGHRFKTLKKLNIIPDLFFRN